jgi:glutamate-1-semialdehyde aminotransferase
MTAIAKDLNDSSMECLRRSLSPSQFEAGFISTAHSMADIEKTTAAAAKVLRDL